MGANYRRGKCDNTSSRTKYHITSWPGGHNTWQLKCQIRHSNYSSQWHATLKRHRNPSRHHDGSKPKPEKPDKWSITIFLFPKIDHYRLRSICKFHNRVVVSIVLVLGPHLLTDNPKPTRFAGLLASGIHFIHMHLTIGLIALVYFFT